MKLRRTETEQTFDTAPAGRSAGAAGGLAAGIVWACALALVAAIASAVPACRAKGTRAGDRCTTSDDCRLPLVCSNRFSEAGVMGICVYPDAVPDAAVPTEDASTPVEDASTTEDASAAEDASTGLDAAIPDSGVEPDAETADASP